MATCRFCKGWRDVTIKYGTRHYAHPDCYLDAGKSLADLSAYQISKFPYRLILERGLLEEAERLTAEKRDTTGGPYG